MADKSLKLIKKVTAPILRQMKAAGEKIVALTCYDYRTAQLLNEAGVDFLLVGDSVGMVKQGHSSTLPVTVEDIIYHTRSVVRGNTRALVVADMPFLSYHVSPKDAVRQCGRVMKEAGAEAVKIEGGRRLEDVFRALQKAQIPVIGHLGMTPQSVNVFGGYKVQGRDSKAAAQLLADALFLESVGVSAIVVECVPSALGKKVSRRLKIPIIGIGAGNDCDGQVLVVDDLIGLTADPLPRFVKRYAQVAEDIQVAAKAYLLDVKSGRFPDDAHTYR